MDKHKYRTDGIPDEVLELMQRTMTIASWMDKNRFEADALTLADKQREYVDMLKLTKQKAKHYADKRLRDFGFVHLRLKRLIASIDDLLYDHQR